MNFKKKIYIPCLLPYPYDTVPGQRFRWEQWEKLLKKKNIFLIKIFFSDHNFINLKNSKNFFIIFYYFYLLIRFFFIILKNIQHKKFIIFRNCTIAGPPFIELFLKCMGKKIIFDFDDAIHLGSENYNNWFFSNIIKCNWKIKFIIKLSSLVIAGNNELKKYALKLNRNVKIIPTTIDIKKYKLNKKKKNYKKNKIVVGWSGSASTSKYIEKFLPTLTKLQKKNNFKIIIIGSKLNINNSKIKCLAWSSKNEIKYLNKIDIGLMPLPNNVWTRGKCGLKILQYLSIGIPSIVSDVGMNSEIILNEKNGYLIKKNKEWEFCIKKLVNNKKLVKKMGINGRRVVEKYFSDTSVINNLSSILILN